MKSIDNYEIYLTTEELSERMKFAQQTLYNHIHEKVFQQGVHFIKPSRKKILWIWPEIEKWLLEKSSGGQNILNIKPKDIASRDHLRIHI
jgi:predicted DNA-binding transcriptional regulator AlpA